MIQHSKALIDANIWIATKEKNSDNQKKATSIISNFKENNIQEFILTDFILTEVVTFTQRKMSFSDAEELYKLIVEQCTVLYTQPSDWPALVQLWKQYKELSLADCSLVLAGKRSNIKTIFSFDAGFDRTSLNRIEQILRK